MTCDEFRKCNESGISGIVQLTRAERSAAGHHWTTCFECRDWSMGITFEVTYDQDMALQATKYRDKQDSEVFFLGLEEMDRFDLDRQATVKEDRGGVIGADHQSDVEIQ